MCFSGSFGKVFKKDVLKSSEILVKDTGESRFKVFREVPENSRARHGNGWL